MDANDIKTFVAEYKKILDTGVATELSYRSTFENLFKKGTHIIPVNDPKVINHNKPDFTFILDTNPDFIIGYAEMKDVGINLDDIEKSNQWARYKSLTNIFLTDGFQWRFYKSGVEYTRIVIAEYDPITKKVKAITDYYESLANQLNYFFDNSTERITSGQKLAEIMGNRARLIRDNILRKTIDDRIDNEDINGIFYMFKELLVSDLSVDSFADIYAQTLIYGLFIARYNDSTPDSFDRREARELIPITNPLLRDFFDHIAGASFDDDLQPIVDNLCQLFCITDVQTIVKKHVNSDDNDYRDPIIHFYEDFLQSYDPDLKKKMGAYYTPTPVVKYIIKMVDSMLKTEFKIVDGLSSSETIPYTYRVDEGYKKGKGTGPKVYYSDTMDIPKVQILDPAVGTATFLNETIRYIYKQKFTNQQGMWNSYVNSNLIKRLNGFEIMMTPYTIAHLKLGMTLKALGATVQKERLRVFLTNTLTEGIKNDLPLFQLFGLTKAVTRESELAAEVKNDYPVMVIIGNPPYSVSSANKSDFILNLIKVYKEDLNEKKINLDDDYIKFIRFSENMIEKNGCGIVSLITNNSYLEGITHRKMREHLLRTFDKIYIVNLHGNARKKETAPDGSKDENVFNIMQGVAIITMIKTSKHKSGLGKVYYSDLYGRRTQKFDALKSEDIHFKELAYSEPYYFFTDKDFQSVEEYHTYVSVNDLFEISNSGIQTKCDNIVVAFDKSTIEEHLSYLRFHSAEEIEQHFKRKTNGGWSAAKAKSVVENYDVDILPYLYRPLDVRYIAYSCQSGLLGRPRESVMMHLAKNDENLSLITSRFQTTFSFGHIMVSNLISDLNSVSMQTGEQSYVFPLYIYSGNEGKRPNFNQEALTRLLCNIGPQAPEDVFYYIYSSLYSPSYRKRFEELLAIDFPRIPIPSLSEFQRLVPLGKELCDIHLMNKKLETSVCFNISGNNTVEIIRYVDNKIYINDRQFFDNVSELAWNLFIGGYQPAQKWLKDRKGRVLDYKEIEHYEQIIAILNKTNEIMESIG